MNKEQILKEINDRINWNITRKKGYLLDIGELVLLHWRTIFKKDIEFFPSIFDDIILIKMLDASNDELVFLKSLVK
jgi:hypothetical protein